MWTHGLRRAVGWVLCKHTHVTIQNDISQLSDQGSMVHDQEYLEIIIREQAMDWLPSSIFLQMGADSNYWQVNVCQKHFLESHHIKMGSYRSVSSYQNESLPTFRSACFHIFHMGEFTEDLEVILTPSSDNLDGSDEKKNFWRRFGIICLQIIQPFLPTNLAILHGCMTV